MAKTTLYGNSNCSFHHWGVTNELSPYFNYCLTYLLLTELYHWYLETVMNIPIGPETPLINHYDDDDESLLRLGSALSNSSSARLRNEIHRLKRARRAFIIICAGHIFLFILLLGIYLGVSRSKTEDFADIFADEFADFHFNRSCIDVFWLSVIQNLLYILLYILLKVKKLMYSLLLAFASTVYLGIKVFAMPLNQGNESPVIYTMIVMTFIMSWLFVYLVDFQFKFTQPGGFMRFIGASIPENRRQISRRNSPGPGPGPGPGPSQEAGKTLMTPDRGLAQRQQCIGSDSEFYATAVESAMGNTGTSDSNTISPEKQISSKSIDKLPTQFDFEELRYKTDFILDFAKTTLLPDNLDWKLEECGAFGTSVFSTETMLDSRKCRILKMEMVIPFSLAEADDRLMEFTPGRSAWDESTDQFSFIENIDDATIMVLLGIHNSEVGKKKNDIVDDVTSLVLRCEKNNDGSIHRYGMSAENEKKISGSSSGPPTCDQLWSGKFLLYGYTLNAISTNVDKSELLFFIAVKRSGIFGLAPGVKSLIQYLLLLSNSLLRIKGSSRTATLNSHSRTLSLAGSSDILKME